MKFYIKHFWTNLNVFPWMITVQQLLYSENFWTTPLIMCPRYLTMMMCGTNLRKWLKTDFPTRDWSCSLNCLSRLSKVEGASFLESLGQTSKRKWLLWRKQRRGRRRGNGGQGCWWWWAPWRRGAPWCSPAPAAPLRHPCSFFRWYCEWYSIMMMGGYCMVLTRIRWL